MLWIAKLAAAVLATVAAALLYRALENECDRQYRRDKDEEN